MLGEVAPFLVPQFDALLLSLLVIAGAMVALGMVSILHRFTRAVVGGVGGLLGRLPGIGEVLSSPVNAVSHWMDREFSAAERALDTAIAHYFHELGQLVDWFGAELRDLAHTVYTLSTHVVGQIAIDVLHDALARVRVDVAAAHALALDTWHVATWARFQITHAADGLIGAAVRTIVHPIEIRLGAFERTITGKVGRLEHDVAVTIPRTIADLRGLTRVITDRLNRLFDRVGALEARLSTTAIAAAVAVALTGLGLSWLRCPNWAKAGRGVCGLPTHLLDDVLALLVDFLVLENICTVLPWIEEAASVVGVPVVDALAGVVGAGSCGGVGAPPRLTTPALHLPAVAGLRLHLAR